MKYVTLYGATSANNNVKLEVLDERSTEVIGGREGLIRHELLVIGVNNTPVWISTLCVRGYYEE